MAGKEGEGKREEKGKEREGGKEKREMRGGKMRGHPPPNILA